MIGLSLRRAIIIIQWDLFVITYYYLFYDNGIDIFPRNASLRSTNTNDISFPSGFPQNLSLGNDNGIDIFPRNASLRSTNTNDISFPSGFPQNLSLGKYRYHNSAPFLSQDCWVDLVDNKRTFFLRTKEEGFPTMKELQEWIKSQPNPITLLMNNQHDKSWPEDLNNLEYELILNESNLHAVYAGNARKLKNYPKLKPLPIGLKWQKRSTQLFGEDKLGIIALYSTVSTTPQKTKKLFELENRTNTVWQRASYNSNSRTKNYIKDNDALRTMRVEIYGILNKTAPRSIVRCEERLSQMEYFHELKKHRFIIGQTGNGLDTHSIWEALLAGCIPIVPKSPLDPMFVDLPVWLIESWEEVTDASIMKVSSEFKKREYDWEKVFQIGWKNEIYKGLKN